MKFLSILFLFPFLIFANSNDRGYSLYRELTYDNSLEDHEAYLISQIEKLSSSIEKDSHNKEILENILQCAINELEDLKRSKLQML